MSGQIYTYEAHFQWKWDKQFDAWATQDEATVKASLTQGFKTAFLAEFAAKMATAGHWFKFDDCTTTFSKYGSDWTLGPLPVLHVHAEGETVIYFESDVQDATAHNSPQLWQIIYEGIQQVFAWLGDHPEIAVGLLVLGVLVVLAVWLINTVTNAIQTLGSNAGSLAIVLGVLFVTGLGIYALFFTKGGRRAASRGVQTARRAYHRVRRR
jgi:hypothetical protein